MRIALAQILSTADPRANLDQVRQYTERAATAGADLILFPEATMCAFGNPLHPIAEPLDGPWAEGIRRISHEAGVAVVAGMFTPADPDRVRNTCLAVTPDGQEASYDKIHLFDAFGFSESDTVAPGEATATLEVAGVRVGLAICYDIRFPKLFAELARAGAQVILVGASWGAGEGKADQWELLARARALDSTSFVAACDQADPASVGRPSHGTSPTGVGHSLVVGPTGTVIDSLGAEPGLLVVDIDPSATEAIRQTIPVLTNARLGY